MTINKRVIEGLTSAAPKVIGAVGLGPAYPGFAGAKYGRVLGMEVRNFASIAKAAAGADILGTIELKDADGFIFYLDAADRDYAAAVVRLRFYRDDTVTGITGAPTPVDQTGAAFSGDPGAANVIGQLLRVVKGPITVTARNFATVTDYLSVTLITEV
jgi:hypothetical protein